MPSVIVPNTALAEIRMIVSGQNVENTLWFEFAGPPTTEQMLGLGADLLSWWANQIAPLVSQAVSVTEVYLSDFTSLNGASATVTPLGPLNGQRSSPVMPNNVSLTVSFRTPFRGRSFRGRNYVVGLTEDQIEASSVTAPTGNAFSSAYQELLAVAANNGAQWVVVSRFTNGAPRPIGLTTPVQSPVVTDLVIDSQRRRLPGRGR